MAARQDRPSLPSPPPPSAPALHGRGFSFGGKSDKSHRSSGSGNKYSETHEEKLRRSLHTKADPTLAMNEAQPGMLSIDLCELITNLRSRCGFGKVEFGVAARNAAQGPIWKCD
jgi:hypothetical protein